MAAVNTRVAAAAARNSLIRLREEARHGAAFRGARVKAPLFIIGHWRSGTTHLYNLLSCGAFSFARIDAWTDQTTLVEAPPLTIREGGLVRGGFSDELDELHRVAGDGKSAMARFQAEMGYRQMRAQEDVMNPPFLFY